MSDVNSAVPQPAHQPFGTAPRENVGLGLAAALLAVLGGMVLTVVLWRIGFIAGLSSFAIAGGGTLLYVKGAGAAPRRGLPPLLLLIVLGVVASFFAIVASDLWDVYGKLNLDGVESRFTFVKDNLFHGELLRHYGKDAAMFAVFAVLGMFGTMRRLIAAAG